MLILNLSDIQYLQKVVFSFDEGSNSQNHCSSDVHHPIKPPTRKMSDPPPPNPLTLFGKSSFEKGDTLCLCKTSINL